MTRPQLDPAFWAGKKVLVTGHTGFKVHGFAIGSCDLVHG